MAAQRPRGHVPVAARPARDEAQACEDAERGDDAHGRRVATVRDEHRGRPNAMAARAVQSPIAAPRP